MSDVINVQKRVETVDIAPAFDAVGQIIVNVDEETQASAGDRGRVIEVDNPLFGSPLVASKMLARARGFVYQPCYANGAILDPSAEMGDAISANDVHFGMFTRERLFGRLMKADLSAPHDEEINHEYKYESPQERKFKREIGDVRASLMIQAGQIEAKVSRESPTGQTSFSWLMNDTAHTWYANGREVVRFDETGGKFKGRVEAESGYIGNERQGFTISATAIYNGMNSLYSQGNGIYVGTDGIALGGGMFRVTSRGEISAANMTLTGTLNIGGQHITAAALRQGAQSAYNNGSYWSGGAGHGYSYNTATGSWATEIPGWFSARTVRAVSNFVFKTTQIGWREARVMSEAGIGITIRYLGEVIGG